jgi:hypothetical protein
VGRRADQPPGSQARDLAGRHPAHLPRRAPARGSQLGFGQTDGFRYEVFLTDLQGDIRDLDLFQREHARVKDRIRDAKNLGLRNLPFRSFACNEVWLLLTGLAQDLLAWAQQLLLTGDLARAERKTLRYRMPISRSCRPRAENSPHDPVFGAIEVGMIEADAELSL